MAVASMSLAVATARLVAVSARAETTLSRNGAVVSMAAPVTNSISCAFSPEFAAVRRTVSVVARAAEVFEAEEEAAPAPVAEQQQGTKLYVGNLPWTCDSAELAELCMDVGTVEAVEVIYDQDTGRSRGFAFVTMTSNEDAEAVIQAYDGKEIGGRPLRVSYPQSNRDKPRFDRSDRPARGAGGDRGGDRRGSPRPNDPNKLFVGNLSWGCDEGALHQLFSDYGKVVDAKVVYDRDSGRSRGFGFVTLADAEEVNRAIDSLDGAEFDGRQMRVNLAGDKPPPRQY